MNYIERYWRDAKPEDAIKDPPMVAKFRQDNEGWIKIALLLGYDRARPFKWSTSLDSNTPQCFRYCQVYDAPDPGEGWRLIDTDSDTKQEGDEYLRRDGTWGKADDCPFCPIDTYRRRIAHAVTYVPFTWEDREQLRGRWVTWKHENGLMIESQINHINQHRDGGLWFKSHDAKWLMENAKFIDTGEPVGKKVTQ